MAEEQKKEWQVYDLTKNVVGMVEARMSPEISDYLKTYGLNPENKVEIFTPDKENAESLKQWQNIPETEYIAEALELRYARINKDTGKIDEGNGIDAIVFPFIHYDTKENKLTYSGYKYRLLQYEELSSKKAKQVGKGTYGTCGLYDPFRMKLNYKKTTDSKTTETNIFLTNDEIDVMTIELLLKRNHDWIDAFQYSEHKGEKDYGYRNVSMGLNYSKRSINELNDFLKGLDDDHKSKLHFVLCLDAKTKENREHLQEVRKILDENKISYFKPFRVFDDYQSVNEGFLKNPSLINSGITRIAGAYQIFKNYDQRRRIANYLSFQKRNNAKDGRLKYNPKEQRIKRDQDIKPEFKQEEQFQKAYNKQKYRSKDEGR